MSALKVNYINTLQTWENHLMQWDPISYAGIDHIVVPTQYVWMPTIGLSNL